MGKKKEGDKSPRNFENNRFNRSESYGDDEPNFSDEENFEDTITDEELLAEFLIHRPREEDSYEGIIVVDGAPQVGPERLEKLKGVIKKMYGKFGTIINEFYPTDEKNVTKGFIFLEYKNPSDAVDAVNATNNYKLDKQHTFLVNHYSDFEKYSNIPDEWTVPEPQEYKDQGNLHYYLLDPDAYDQYCLICSGGSTVQIWQNAAPEPTVVEERPNWTETYVRWSPLGTYMATFHARGVALWGGPKFKQIMRFSHTGVQLIDFSPCERYLVTYSPDGPSDQRRVIIWDVRTGAEKRSFSLDGVSLWPVFRWSPDDKFFARIGQDVLSVYETPSFGLLDKRSIKIPGIRDFAWSPTDNILVYWVAEDKDVPARVCLLEIPSRQEVRANNLFNVADCKIHWQKSGDYLCVKVDRYSKVKKEKNDAKYSVSFCGMYYNFEIFHMREKLIPVDSVEIKEPIHAFAWEPVGSKFAIIHGDQHSINVSFYGVKQGQPPSLLKKFEKRQCNHLFWSPTGQFIVLAGLRSMHGSLEFIDTNEFVVMNAGEHYTASDVEWDPTGRYVVTGVSSWKQKVDNGFWLWSFQGKKLKKHNIDGFCQLMWRPRPPSLLSAKQQKEIKKNLKKYTPQFESKDRMRSTRASKELIEKRCQLMKTFEEYRQKNIQAWNEAKTRRLELRNNVDTDELESDTKNVEEEEIEFLVKEEHTVIEE
ncbi:Hypothetical predicted protein [Cloeon dipterum]|uniref:Eukaryotic translation initiation factor 3 subunit B n=2 Tax=Cloeon dipterum TaxID=197152 RepID=A0A8S1DE83_9INSE|nr:Hypothetical predicted protein [Cloeon dipterum]